MQEIFLCKNPCEKTKPLGRCSVCGSAVYDGDELFLTRNEKIPVGCVSCIITLLKRP